MAVGWQWQPGGNSRLGAVAVRGQRLLGSNGDSQGSLPMEHTHISWKPCQSLCSKFAFGFTCLLWPLQTVTLSCKHTSDPQGDPQGLYGINEHSTETLAVSLSLADFLKADLRLGITAYFLPRIMHRCLHVAYPSVLDLVLWDIWCCA